MSDTPKEPVIETLAHRITVARDALATSTVEREKANQQIRIWTNRADKAGEQIAMLETRLTTLRRQIADEASR